MTSTQKRNFNPRPRKEGDLRQPLTSCHNRRISIHALAKRATNVILDFPEIQNISIHALAKRATDQSVYCTPNNYNFNPRPRKEGDGSIFAPTNIIQRFQSTPSQRGRQVVRLNFFSVLVFQSTPSQRGRLNSLELRFVLLCISIHALAKRATFCLSYDRSLFVNFNPRPRKEGDWDGYAKNGIG